MRAPILSACLVLACALAPAGAAAQLRVVPQAGMFVPLSDIPHADEAAEIGERDASFAWGLAVQLGSLRLTGLRGTDSGIPVGGVGCTDCVRSSVTAVTATWMLRPFPELVVASPWVMLGGGFRRLDFERDELDEERFDAFFSDETDPALHLGVGIEIDLPVLRITGELSDVLSRLESPDGESSLQHDFFLMLGLSFGS